MFFLYFPGILRRWKLLQIPLLSKVQPSNFGHCAMLFLTDSFYSGIYLSIICNVKQSLHICLTSERLLVQVQLGTEPTGTVFVPVLYSVKSNMQSYQLWQLLVTKEQPKVALMIAWHSLILLVLCCLVTFCKKLHRRVQAWSWRRQLASWLRKAFDHFPFL